MAESKIVASIGRIVGMVIVPPRIVRSRTFDSPEDASKFRRVTAADIRRGHRDSKSGKFVIPGRTVPRTLKLQGAEFVNGAGESFPSGSVTLSRTALELFLSAHNASALLSRFPADGTVPTDAMTPDEVAAQSALRSAIGKSYTVTVTPDGADSLANL